MTPRPKDRALRVASTSRVSHYLYSEGSPRESHEFGFGGPPVGSPRASGIDSSRGLAEARGKCAARTPSRCRSGTPPPMDGTARASGFFPAHHLRHRRVQDEIRGKIKKPLRVLKFG